MTMGRIRLKTLLKRGLYLAAVLSLAIFFTVFAEESTAGSKKTPQEISTMINALPELSALTAEDEQTVQSIRASYDALPEADQKKIDNADKLIQAEEKLSLMGAASSSDYQYQFTVKDVEEYVLVINYADKIPDLSLTSPDKSHYPIHEVKATDDADTKAEETPPESTSAAAADSAKDKKSENDFSLDTDLSAEGVVTVYLHHPAAGNWQLESSAPVSMVEAQSKPQKKQEEEKPWTTERLLELGKTFILPFVLIIVVVVGTIIAVKAVKKNIGKTQGKKKKHLISGQDGQTAKPERKSTETRNKKRKVVQVYDPSDDEADYEEEEEPLPIEDQPKETEEEAVARMKQEVDALWEKHAVKQMLAKKEAPEEEKKPEEDNTAVYWTQDDLDNDITIEEFIDEEEVDGLPIATEDEEKMRKRRGFFPENRF